MAAPDKLPVTADNSPDAPGTRAPLVLGDDSFHTLTEQISGYTEKKPPLAWYAYTAIASLILMIYGGAFTYLVGVGTGTWGLNHPVGWAWDITGFVFWIGIGHAGTLI